MSSRREDSDWFDYSMVVQMPHMAPVGRLSEVELLKWLGAFQWDTISQTLQCPSARIANADGDRLYASFIDLELHFGSRHSQETLGEGTALYMANRIRFYAKKFVEGVFLIDEAPLARSRLEGIGDRAQLASMDVTWAAMTNAFIAREGSNTRLKVFKPQAADEIAIPQLLEPPVGVAEQARVKSGGIIDDPGWAIGRELHTARTQPVEYHISLESDLNGAGLLYFARYPAIVNYGERLFLGACSGTTLSTPFISCLSTVHRKLLFFANAGPEDGVTIATRAQVLSPADYPAPVAPMPYDVPLQMLFRTELRRSSDDVLMATSIARKSLNVRRDDTGVLHEAERLLQALSASKSPVVTD